MSSQKGIHPTKQLVTQYIQFSKMGPNRKIRRQKKNIWNNRKVWKPVTRITILSQQGQDGGRGVQYCTTTNNTWIPQKYICDSWKQTHKLFLGSFPSPDGNHYKSIYTPWQKKNQNTGTQHKVSILNQEQYPIPTEEIKSTFETATQWLQGG